jgi:hypothetical protein
VAAKKRLARLAAGPERSAKEVRAAVRAFAKLDRATQFRLCREIADTRGQELTLAYTNLVSVGFGYKTRGRAGSKAEAVDFRRPCVVFVVSRKWRSTGKSADPQRLPTQLFTYVGANGERVLCAVPTDVKPLTTFGKASRPHNDLFAARPYGIAVERNGDDRTAFGVVACAIERADEAGLFALSCRHVYGMSLQGPEYASGCEVQSIGGQKAIGSTVNVRGPLVSEPTRSFDAQLARVTNRAALKSALSSIRFEPGDPSALGPEEVPAQFWVLTPRRDGNGNRLKVWVEARDYVTRILPYDGLDVVHHHILHAIASEPLMAGDSGSPAVPVAAGRKLIGMYIGGDGTNAYIIPAWQLVRGANYGRPGENLWTVVNA